MSEECFGLRAGPTHTTFFRFHSDGGTVSEAIFRNTDLTYGQKDIHAGARQIGIVYTRSLRPGELPPKFQPSLSEELKRILREEFPSEK